MLPLSFVAYTFPHAPTPTHVRHTHTRWPQTHSVCVFIHGPWFLIKISLSLSLSLSLSVPITKLFAWGRDSGGQSRCMCFITAGPITKLFAWGGEESGGHVLRETTSRGLCGLVCPSHTSERGG